MSKFVEPGVLKIVKLELLGSIRLADTAFFDFFLSKMAFSQSFEMNSTYE